MVGRGVAVPAHDLVPSLSLLGTGLAFLVWFGTDRLAIALAAAVAAGAFAIVFLVGHRTQVQLLTPDRLLGRVSAAFLAAETAASLAGTGLGGTAAGLVGFGPAVTIAGAVILAAGLLKAAMRQPATTPTLA